jgi:hypothetical protein
MLFGSTFIRIAGIAMDYINNVREIREGRLT